MYFISLDCARISRKSTYICNKSKQEGGGWVEEEEDEDEEEEERRRRGGGEGSTVKPVLRPPVFKDYLC